MGPVYRTRLESSDEFSAFERILTRQIIDLLNYELVVHVKVLGGDDGEEDFGSMVFHPTGAESYQFMTDILHALVTEDLILKVTVNNLVNTIQA